MPATLNATNNVYQYTLNVICLYAIATTIKEYSLLPRSMFADQAN